MYEGVKRRKCATEWGRWKRCDNHYNASRQTWWYEDSAGEEEANPEPVHFFRNMLEAEAEIALPLSCRDSKNIRKRNNVSGGKVMW